MGGRCDTALRGIPVVSMAVHKNMSPRSFFCSQIFLTNNALNSPKDSSDLLASGVYF